MRSTIIFQLLLTFVFIFGASELARAQQVQPEKPKVQSTAAYAEVLANRVEADADLKALMLDYSEEAPQVKAKKLERDLLQRQIRWLEVLPDTSQGKMTAALGRLLVRKAQVEATMKTLGETYAEQHPLVKKARAKFDVYNSEIEKLLQ
jgi:hypothetical protein